MRYREIISERENLASWFAGSKVVDEHGKPKRMYHGSRSAFASFDPSKANDDALVGPGFYFTDSPDVAGGTGSGPMDDHLVANRAAFNQAGYAFQGTEYEVPPLTPKQMEHFRRIFNSKQVQSDWMSDIGSRESWQKASKAYDDGPEALAKWLANRAPDWVRERMKIERVRTTTPTVYPVYLSIKHPFEMDQMLSPEEAQALRKKMWDASTQFIEGGQHHETFENATAGYRGANRPVSVGYVWEWLVKRIFSNNKKKVTATLIAMGYDGIRHTGGQVVGTMGKHDVWIAFYPSQIKSIFATKYDGMSSDIGESA